MNGFLSGAWWRAVVSGQRRGWSVIGAAVLGAAVLAAALTAVLGKPGGAPPAHGRWAGVEAQAQTFELMAVGRVAPARLIELPSAATGTLDDVKVAWGDRVEQGQSLARIASVELDAQVRTAEAAMLRARLQDGGALAGEPPAEVRNARRRQVAAQGALHTARSREADSQALYAKGFVSRLDRDAAALEVDNAGAELAAAEEEVRAASLKYAPEHIRALRLEATNRAAELAQLRQRQALLHVKAPLAGVVLQPAPREGGGPAGPRELVRGAKLAAGDAVLAIGDTSALLVQANCSEGDMAWLDVGMPAQVTVAALPARAFKATVARLGTATRSRHSFPGQGSPEFECDFAFQADAKVLSDEDLRRLRIGGSAKVRVSHAAVARQASIPVAAVMWAPDGKAQLRWRASAQDPATVLPVHVVRAGLDDVQLRDALRGEIWVPADPTAAAPPVSFLSRMLGVAE
jgi:HlyD family secretion protein